MITEKDVQAALPKLAPHVTVKVQQHKSDYRIVMINLFNHKPRDPKKAQAACVIKFEHDNEEDNKKHLQKELEKIVSASRPYGFFT